MDQRCIVVQLTAYFASGPVMSELTEIEIKYFFLWNETESKTLHNTPQLLYSS